MLLDLLALTFKIDFMCECFAFTMCIQCPQRLEEGARQTHMGGGTGTRVFCKNSECSYRLSLLSISLTFLKKSCLSPEFSHRKQRDKSQDGVHICWHLCTVIWGASLLRKFFFQKLWYTQVARTVSWTLIAAQKRLGVVVLSHPKPCNSNCTKDLSKTNVSHSFPPHSLKSLPLICLSVYLSTNSLSICLPSYLPISLSSIYIIYLSTCQSTIYSSIYLDYLSIVYHIFIYDLSIIYSSTYLSSIHPYIHIYVYI